MGGRRAPNLLLAVEMGPEMPFLRENGDKISFLDENDVKNPDFG